MMTVRRLILALMAALSLSLGTLPDVAAAKPAKPAKTAKAKGAKGKPGAKASAATKGKAKGAKAKAGAKGKAVGKGAGAKAKGKAVAKDGKGQLGKGKGKGKTAKPGELEAGVDKPGIKGKKSLKPPKPAAKGKFAAKAGVEDLEEEFEGEEDMETTSGPWLIVFVLFVLLCVAVFIYMKKKSVVAPAREDFNYKSSPEQAFGSSLSSLDLDRKKAAESGKSRLGSPEDTDPNGTGGGGGGAPKKPSWKDQLLGKLRGAGAGLKEKAKAEAARAAKGAVTGAAGDLAGGVGGGLAGSLGSAVGGDAVGALAGDLAADAAQKAATKAVTNKLDKKPASKPAAATATATASAAPPVPAPGPRAAHAEPSVHMMNAAAAAAAPGASLRHDASSEEFGAGSHDGKLKPEEWCGWDKVDPEEFWYRVYDVEAGGIESDEALERRMVKYGFKGKSHFDRVKEAYLARTPSAQEQQVMMNARMRQMKEAQQASAAANAPLFAPIDGVSLETYAKIMARKGRLTSNDASAVDAVYAEFGVTATQFDKANAGWQDRMSNQKDPATIGALMGEYSKHFSAGSTGRFAGAAQAGAAASDRANIAGIGQDPAGAEPCTLERYVEIMSAQKIWAERNEDIGANLQKHFGITIMDWADLGSYWSPKIIANVKYIEDGTMRRLQDKYEALYRGKVA